jgi:hypothetical protein
MTLTRGLSLVLALAAVVLAVLAAMTSVRVVAPHCSWHNVDAVVYEIDTHSVNDNRYGSVVVTLRYGNGRDERYATASRSLWRSRGERFARDYAVGTRHTVRIDPGDPKSAELEDWNLERMLTLIFLCVFCICLLMAARYFWPFQ